LGLLVRKKAEINIEEATSGKGVCTSPLHSQHPYVLLLPYPDLITFLLGEKITGFHPAVAAMVKSRTMKEPPSSPPG
jgi:hypothetical protein